MDCREISHILETNLRIRSCWLFVKQVCRGVNKWNKKTVPYIGMTLFYLVIVKTR